MILRFSDLSQAPDDRDYRDQTPELSAEDEMPAIAQRRRDVLAVYRNARIIRNAQGRAIWVDGPSGHYDPDFWTYVDPADERESA